MKRIEELDSLKFILIVLVIFGHILEQTGSFLWLRDYIYIWHMPVFVFITGMTFKKYLFKNETLLVLKKTIIPFLFFQIVFFIFTRGNLNLLIPYYHLWYIYSLTFWYFFSKYFKTYLKEAFLISLFAVLILSYSKYYSYTFGIGRTLTFLPFFLLGANYELSEKYFKTTKAVCDILILIIGTFLLFKYNNVYFKLEPLLKGSLNYQGITDGIDGRISPIMKLAYYAIAFSYIYFIINFFYKFKIKIFSNYGKETFYYYIYHVFFLIILIGKLNKKGLMTYVRNNLLHLILITLFILILCFLLKKSINLLRGLLYKKSPKLIKLFFEIHPN